jgi:omega-6 fatty acid desaturase (delta-12 desaturase)
VRASSSAFFILPHGTFRTRAGPQPYRGSVRSEQGNERPTRPPAPSELRHLQPQNSHGGALILLCLSLTFGGIWLSVQTRVAAWMIGQILTAAAFLHWFVILHECGHETLFRSRRWHRFVGPVAGAFSLIPFAAWTRVHGRHHKWTGWQDLDPTTAALVPRERSRASRVVVNVCWRLWIPLFSCVYRIENYWNLPRLKRLFTGQREQRTIQKSLLSLLALYSATLLIVGPATLTRVAGLAILLSFIAEDVLLLSQHTHVPQHVSQGAPVRPYPAPEQEVFTRSLRLPGWASAWLLHFDAHELHHMYPFVPGYHLRAIRYRPEHEIGWWQWIRGAKQLRGDVLLFQNREESGWEL